MPDVTMVKIIPLHAEDTYPGMIAISRYPMNPRRRRRPQLHIPRIILGWRHLQWCIEITGSLGAIVTAMEYAIRWSIRLCGVMPDDIKQRVGRNMSLRVVMPYFRTVPQPVVNVDYWITMAQQEVSITRSCVLITLCDDVRLLLQRRLRKRTSSIPSGHS